MAPVALRFSLVLGLVFCMAYNPLHLRLEPHSDGSDQDAGTGPTPPGHMVARDQQRGNDHHEPHPAAQHKLTVTPPARALFAAVMPLQTLEWVEIDVAHAPSRLIAFSGLSPPELPRSWQFIFRAALPVRAPSLLS